MTSFFGGPSIYRAFWEYVGRDDQYVVLRVYNHILVYLKVVYIFDRLFAKQHEMKHPFLICNVLNRSQLNHLVPSFS